MRVDRLDPVILSSSSNKVVRHSKMFIKGNKYILLNIRKEEYNGELYKIAIVQNLTNNEVFNCPLHTLIESKGNYTTAVFANKDVSPFSTVFTVADQTSEVVTVNGVTFLNKINTFKVLYEL